MLVLDDRHGLVDLVRHRRGHLAQGGHLAAWMSCCSVSRRAVMSRVEMTGNFAIVEVHGDEVQPDEKLAAGLSHVLDPVLAAG